MQHLRFYPESAINQPISPLPFCPASTRVLARTLCHNLRGLHTLLSLKMSEMLAGFKHKDHLPVRLYKI